jgi:4-hydroxysphinganine ceramide fatty acyl 2-hydroxylase
MEYFLHRFLFHSEDKWLPGSKGNFPIVAHFMFHGIHHAFPMDKLRLVFPP